MAAPNCYPTDLQSAVQVARASPLATPIATPAPAINDDQLQQYEVDLKKREPIGTIPATTLSSLSIANSFTDDSNSSSTAAATSSAVGSMATGMFTGADGGVYDVTSQSGYVVVDFKTLSPGQGALIGNEEVSEGADGLVANGVTIALTPVTGAVAASTTSAAMTTSSEASSTASSSGGSSVIAAGTTVATVSAVASSSSSAAAAAPTQQAGGVLLAAAGGLLGFMLL